METMKLMKKLQTMKRKIKERKSVDYFIKRCYGRIKTYKIENIGSSMPDLLCINRFGTVFWIEAKVLTKPPKKDNTFPLKNKFEKGQQAFGRNWISWEGKHFVLLRIVYSTNDYWYLLNVNNGDLEEKTFEQLRKDSLIMSTFDGIIYYLSNLK